MVLLFTVPTWLFWPREDLNRTAIAAHSVKKQGRKDRSFLPKAYDANVEFGFAGVKRDKVHSWANLFFQYQDYEATRQRNLREIRKGSCGRS